MTKKLGTVLVVILFSLTSFARVDASGKLAAEPSKKKEIMGVMVKDLESGDLCLVDHANYDLKSPAFAEHSLGSYQASADRFADIPTCSDIDNEWAEASSAVSYSQEQGPEMAALVGVAVGYFLVCGAFQAVELRMDHHIANGKDNWKTRSFKGVTGVVNQSVCVPVTWIKKAIVYVF